MMIPPIDIAGIVFSLIEQVVANKLTKQNINDKVKDLTEKVNHEFYKRDRIIGIFEEKIKELETQLLNLANQKIDEVEKKVEDKTPFFVHGMERTAAQTVKDEIHKTADNVVEQVVNEVEALEQKVIHAVPGLVELVKQPETAPSTPIETPVNVPVHSDPISTPVVASPETGHTHQDEVDALKKEASDFLSSGAQEALKELKDKFQSDSGSEPKKES